MPEAEDTGDDEEEEADDDRVHSETADEEADDDDIGEWSSESEYECVFRYPNSVLPVIRRTVQGIPARDVLPLPPPRQASTVNQLPRPNGLYPLQLPSAASVRCRFPLPRSAAYARCLCASASVRCLCPLLWCVWFPPSVASVRCFCQLILSVAAVRMSPYAAAVRLAPSAPHRYAPGAERDRCARAVLVAGLSKECKAVV